MQMIIFNLGMIARGRFLFSFLHINPNSFFSQAPSFSTNVFFLCRSIDHNRAPFSTPLPPLYLKKSLFFNEDALTSLLHC